MATAAAAASLRPSYCCRSSRSIAIVDDSMVWPLHKNKKMGVLGSSVCRELAILWGKKRLGGVSHTIKIRVLSVETTLVFFGSRAQL